MKLGVMMQNNIPMAGNKMSTSRPEVEFQYGGRLFSETGSSNIYLGRGL